MLLLWVSFSAATAGKSDSLIAIWQDPAGSDSSRVQAYRAYIWDGFLFSQPDSAFILADDLTKFSREQEYPEGMATSMFIKAISQYLQGNYTLAYDFNQASIEISESLQNKNLVASSLNLHGLIFEKQGYDSKALEYHQRSLRIREEMGDQRGIASSLNNIGEILEHQGNSIRALDYFQRSLAITEELNDKRGIATALMNIGKSYFNQCDYSQVLNYYKRSLKYYEDLNDHRGIGQCLNAIGSAYYAQNEIDEALQYYRNSYDVCEELGDKRGMVISMIGIGNTYLHLKDHSRSLEYCLSSFKLAEEIDALALQRDACECIYKNNRAMNDKGQALDYLEKLNTLNDSLNGQETAKELQQMEFNFQLLQDSIARTEEQRKVEQAYKEEVFLNKRTKYIFLGSGLFFLILAGGFYSRWRYVRKSKTIIEYEKDRSDNLLLNILPAEIAEELKTNGKAEAREFDMVSVLFTDFINFTKTSAMLTAKELVSEINACFEAFDFILEKYHIEKIKTIGDAYMAAGGLPVPTDDSVKNTVLAALDMQDFINYRKSLKNKHGKGAFEMRIGIHTGPVVAGVVGMKKFQYDIWGDTVNTASRMESNSEAGEVNISQCVYDTIKDDPQFSFTSRGKIDAKGKGEVEMYFVKMERLND